MMAIELQQPTVSVIALGSFQPSRATPSALSEAGAIRADEAREAQFITLVKDQAVEFNLAWGRMSVVPNRFGVEATVPPYVRVADLIQKTVGELMPSASVEKLGINAHYPVKFGSEVERNEFGCRLSVPSSWGNWGREIAAQVAQNSKDHGGVVSVTMRQESIPGREGGWRDVQVVASSNVTEAIFAINSHFEYPPTTQSGLEPRELDQRRTAFFMRILGEQFDQEVAELERIAHDVIKG